MMKNHLLNYLVIAVLLLSSCEEKEEPIPAEPTFNYYFKFEAEGKKYSHGFDQIVDQFNPYEVYNDVPTRNFITVGSSGIYASIREFCGDEQGRDCILGTFIFNARAIGTVQADEIGAIIGNETGEYVRFLTSDMEHGNLTITISKADPVNRIIEASFSGKLYNRYTATGVLVPIEGAFRAYYNPQ